MVNLGSTKSQKGRLIALPDAHHRLRPEHMVTMGARPRVVRHHVEHQAWQGRDLTIAVLSDFHICRPWTPLSALSRIAEATMCLAPDLIVLGGDFIGDRNLPALREPADRIIAALAPLHAPLGVHAILGNHDWWDCLLARRSGFRRNSVVEALAASGRPPLSNRAIALRHGAEFWLVGLDSQQGRKGMKKPGFEDPEAAFAAVPPGAPAILLAHEPDYFALGDDRAFLQISGHTHGGQANLFGWRPLTPSRYGGRYAWGHIRERGRHLIVSGGIGYSGIPMRILAPPEITLVRVTGA